LGLDPARQGARVRRHTGVLTETPSLDERLTGRESLSIYADLYGVPSADVPRRVEALLDTFDLGARGDDRIGSYSKGMRQRLALARAILHNPVIVFLDEPTSSLDPVAARHVHQLVEQLSQKGHTVFLCTHNLAEAQSLCDRVAVLEHGRVVALGTPAELGRQLGNRLRLEIEVAADQVDAAVSTLQTVPELTGLTRNTHSLMVQGPDREVVPRVVNCLVQAGVSIYRVVPQEPSLEDVYFALHDEKEAAV
jgi:ABC-2 type transport system ATP-binding protein